MNQVAIKVYSKTDVHTIRKLIREETTKHLSALTNESLIQSLYNELSIRKIALTENDKASIRQFIQDSKNFDIEKLKKEVHKFCKGIGTTIKYTSLDTLPENTVSVNKEDFDKHLFEVSTLKVNELATKLKKAKEKLNQRMIEWESEVSDMYKLVLEHVNKQIEDTCNKERLPELSALKELQMIRSEIVAEEHIQKLTLNQQNIIKDTFNTH